MTTKCAVGLHGAGPTPMAVHEVKVPVGEKEAWVPACSDCVTQLRRDAARDLKALQYRALRRAVAGG